MQPVVIRRDGRAISNLDSPQSVHEEAPRSKRRHVDRRLTRDSSLKSRFLTRYLGSFHRRADSHDSVGLNTKRNKGRRKPDGRLQPELSRSSRSVLLTWATPPARPPRRPPHCELIPWLAERSSTALAVYSKTAPAAALSIQACQTGNEKRICQ